MDIWGRCPRCAAWFPCEGWFDRTVPEPTCPDCGVAPVAIENRAIVIRVPDPEVAEAS
jgi:hypothetical protein